MDDVQRLEQEKRFSSTVAKLIMLGNRVEMATVNTVIARNWYSKKETIVAIGCNCVRTSKEYDSIKYLHCDEYYLVRVRNSYNVVMGDSFKSSTARYSGLYGGILTASGNCNLIAKLSNGLSGVIDVNDNTIVPFINSHISMYRVGERLVYVGTVLDTSKFYDADGELLGVTSLVDKKQFIVCEDCILIYSFNKDETINAVVAGLDGNIMYKSSNIFSIKTVMNKLSLIDEYGDRVYRVLDSASVLNNGR